MSVLFDTCATITLAHEGPFSCDHADPGNWTGGAVGSGRLVGTAWGISAASYPDLDIPHLSREAALAIYERDYWQKYHDDDLPPGLALLHFDAAVNNGPGRANKWLQQAVFVYPDGTIGPVTLAAVAARSWQDTARAFMAFRLLFMTGLATWKIFGAGWSRRLAALPFQAVAIAGGTK
jgi:lysozyme family protein